MHQQIGRRVAAITTGLAATAALLASTAVPAEALASWTTLHKTPRGVTSQACRSSIAGTDKVIYPRGDNRGASVGAYFQEQSWRTSDGITNWGYWDWVSKGKAKTLLPFEADKNESFKIRMRTKTKYGTSNWSKWVWYSNLRQCD